MSEEIIRWKLKSHRQADLPLSRVPLSQRKAERVGKVVVMWSGFEEAMNALIHALLQYNQVSSKKWEWKSFRQKRDLLLLQARITFGSRTFLTSHIDSVCRKAAIHQISRNLIVHGRFLLHYTQEDNVLIFQLRHGKKIIEGHFRDDELDTLYNQIGHITSRMRELTDLSTIEDIPVPSVEKMALRTVLEANPLIYPIKTLPIRAPRLF